MKKMTTALLVTGLLAVSSSAAIAAEATAPGLASEDVEFFAKAGAAGLAEVQIAKLAASKSTNTEVKSFASQMVKEHSAANDKLKALADAKGITLPATPDHEQQEALNELSGKKQKKFDEEFMEQVVKDHHETIELFEEASTDSKDPDIRMFASNTLPTLHHHDEMAKALKKKVD